MIDSKRFRCFGLILCLFLGSAMPVLSQSAGRAECDLILLELNVERTLHFDLEGLLCNEELYLPAVMFSDLNIPFEYRSAEKVLTIRFPNPDHSLRFDFKRKKIESNSFSSDLKESDFILDETGNYIRKDLLGELVDLDIIFNYRELSVLLYSDTKLPVIEQFERKQRYENFTEPSREISPDFIVPTRRHLMKGFVADWSLNNSHNTSGSNYSYHLGLGGHLLGGVFRVRGSGSEKEAVNREQAKGQWSYPVYSTPLIKQVQVGDLLHENSPAAESSSFQGIKITNTPNAPRRYFDNIIFSDILQDDRDTELYINRRFSDYATAAGNQSYNFTAPLTYGSNLIQLKHFDSNGFYSQDQYLIHIPREFLPPGKLEYDFSAGRYSRNTDRYFGRMNLNWGLSSKITVGGGSVIESTANEQQVLPFMQTWFRPGKHIIIRGGHTLNRLSGGSFRMALPGSQSITLGVKKFHGTSEFNKTGKSFESSLNTSFPVRLPLISFSALMSTRYIISESGNRSLNIYSGISAGLPLGIHLRANSRLMFRNNQTKSLVPVQHTGRVNLSKRLFHNLLLRPELEYSHTRKHIINSKLKLRYRISRDINLDFSFYRDHLLKNNRLQFNLRLDLPFARHTSTVRSARGAATLYQNTGGSILFNGNRRSLDFDRRNKIGKASLRINPFLDYNLNSRRDNGEPVVEGVAVDLYRKDRSKPLYRNLQKIDNLVPYEEYLIRINDADLSNPLLRPRHRSYSVQVLPNCTNSLSIPIITTGEAAGKVISSSENEDLSLLKGLRISVTSDDSDFTKELETYWEGNFYYVGLNPGNYTAALDRKQLENRNLKAVSDSLTFTIEPVRNGDIVDGLKLEVAVRESTEETNTDRTFAIQTGAYKIKTYALRHAALSRVKTGYDVSVIYDAGKDLYFSRFGSFDSRREAWRVLNKLKSRGAGVYRDAFVVEVSERQ